MTTLLLILFGSQAFAYVGDASAYQGYYHSTCENSAKLLQTSYEIISEASDASGNQKTEIKKRLWFAGEVSETFFFYNQSFDGRPFGDKNFLMDYCRKAKGTLEWIQVLEKDTFACRISSVDELGWTVNTWVGYSPLGILKWTAQRENPGTSCVEMIEQNASSFRFAGQ